MSVRNLVPRRCFCSLMAMHPAMPVDGLSSSTANRNEQAQTHAVDDRNRLFQTPYNPRSLVTGCTWGFGS
jgi:hypothetical protein